MVICKLKHLNQNYDATKIIINIMLNMYITKIGIQGTHVILHKRKFTKICKIE